MSVFKSLSQCMSSNRIKNTKGVKRRIILTMEYENILSKTARNLIIHYICICILSGNTFNENLIQPANQEQ